MKTEGKRPTRATGSSSRKTSAPRRKQQRTTDTRLKIVKAALSEFSSRGFENASTRGISEIAGVPHSLVLYHFESKEKLWYETAKEVVGWYTHQLDEPMKISRNDPAKLLKRVLGRYILFSAANPEFFRMLSYENMVNSDRLRWFVENHVLSVVTSTTRLIREAQAKGLFVKGDPITLLYLFLGTATSPYRSAGELELLTGKSPYDQREIERHIRLCERLFFKDGAIDA